MGLRKINNWTRYLLMHLKRVPNETMVRKAIKGGVKTRSAITRQLSNKTLATKVSLRAKTKLISNIITDTAISMFRYNKTMRAASLQRLRTLTHRYVRIIYESYKGRGGGIEGEYYKKEGSKIFTEMKKILPARALWPYLTEVSNLINIASEAQSPITK